MKLIALLNEIRNKKNEFDNKEISLIKRIKLYADEFDIHQSSKWDIQLYKLYYGPIGDERDEESNFIDITKELEKKSRGKKFRYKASETIADSSGEYPGTEIASSFIETKDSIKELKKFIKQIEREF